jgi:uncharacterized protein involved in exopolysaccharide biosynthesis
MHHIEASSFQTKDSMISDDHLEEGYSLADYLSILRRRRWQLIVPALILFTVAAIAAVSIPATYRSQATILIEQQEIPQDLVRSTVTSYADQRVQVISQRVLNSKNLIEVIEKYDLYAKERNNATMASLVQKMRKDIQLKMVSADVVDPRSGRPTAATIAFTLAYESKSPVNAQKVANEVVSLFLNENIKKRREVAHEASKFLSEEADKLSEQISDLEARLAVFKEANSGSLPEMQSLNMTLMQRVEDQLRRNDQDERVLDERIIYLESELAQLNPYSNLYSTTGERMLSVSDRLKSLQSEYVSVASRYSESHPDRIKMKRELEALQAKSGESGIAELQRRVSDLERELSSLSKRYSKDHPDVKRKQRELKAVNSQLAQARKSKPKPSANEQADNPAYVQLQTQLQAAHAERRSLKSTHDELEARLNDFEQRLSNAPKIEREYRAITRDYDNAMAKFKEVKAKQLEAELAESLEAGSKAERFVLIEPPLLPEKPSKPNRLAILFLGVVFSVGGGVGTVVLRESMDDAIHGPKDIEKIIGAPPLAVIPYLQTDEEIAARKRRKALYVITATLAVAGLLAAVHFYYRPLDVLYLQLMQLSGFMQPGQSS